jgi:hypothetical protein
MEMAFRFADLKNDKKIIDKITSMEKELSEEAGKKLILIAYDDKK